MNNKKTDYQTGERGFTLIELLIYMAIVTIIISALTPFTLSIITTSTKSSVQQEVNGQARFISEKLKYEIRNATGINSVTATSISLATSLPATNPTVIDLSAGKIRIKQGSGAVVNLNSNDSLVSVLTFTNYTSGDNKTKNIQFQMTITDNYTSTRQEYVQTTSIQGSAEIRSN